MIPESEIRRRRVKVPVRGVELELVDFGGRGPLTVLAHATGFCADTLAPRSGNFTRRRRISLSGITGAGFYGTFQACARRTPW